MEDKYKLVAYESLQFLAELLEYFDKRRKQDDKFFAECEDKIKELQKLVSKIS